jgi:hypothetical protein
MTEVSEYRGRHITVLLPSGMYEVGVDNGHGGTTFDRYDDLDDAKAALDADIEKIGC